MSIDAFFHFIFIFAHTASVATPQQDKMPVKASGAWARIKLELAKLRVYGWYGVGTLVLIDAVTFAAVYVTLSSGFDLGKLHA